MTAVQTAVAQESEIAISPRYFVVKLIETDKWAPEIATKARCIFGVYLFDANRHVHCCEITPSYECHFVESQWDNPDLSARDADWLNVDITEADTVTEPVRYFHCRQIDALPNIRKGTLAVGVIDLGISDEEEAFEFLRTRSI